MNKMQTVLNFSQPFIQYLMIVAKTISIIFRCAKKLKKSSSIDIIKSRLVYRSDAPYTFCGIWPTQKIHV